MDFISCPECGNQFLNTTIICPECNISIIISTQSIQKISKKFEANILLSLIAIFSGLIWLYIGSDIVESYIISVYFPSAFILIGLIWYFVAVFKLLWVNKSLLK